MQFLLGGTAGLLHSNAGSPHVHFLKAEGFPCLHLLCPVPVQPRPRLGSSRLECFSIWLLLVIVFIHSNVLTDALKLRLLTERVTRQTVTTSAIALMLFSNFLRLMSH